MGRNVGWYSIMMVSLLCAGVTHAECTRPRPDFQIPDGATASEAQLNNTKTALQRFDEQVGKYLRCLEGEASQKLVGKDEAARIKVRDGFIASFNSAADELSGLGECYNAQMQAATQPKASDTKKMANCSEFIKKAGTRNTAASNAVVRNSFVTESEGYTTELTDGAWSFALVRSEEPKRCTKGACLQRVLFVKNSSPRTLECTGSITYAGTDVEGKATREGKAIVDGKSARALVSSYALSGVDASTFVADCKPRSELPPLSTPATCKYEVIKPVTIGDYYSEAARNAAQEGPVTVEFSVGDKPANPTDVKVAASSLFPALDEGAVKAVQAMVMSSNCASGRYRLKLTFRLQ